MGVAVASHNELLIGFMIALSEAIYAGTEDEAFVDAEVRAVTTKAHLMITSAIRDRDAATAERRMRKHVHGYADALAEIGRARGDRRRRCRRGRITSAAAPRACPEEESKMALVRGSLRSIGSARMATVLVARCHA